MHINRLAFAVVILSSGWALSQETDESMDRRIALMKDTFQVAGEGMIRTKSFEPTPAQTQRVLQLLGKFQSKALNLSLFSRGKISIDQRNSLFSELVELEDTLLNNVLLPHQIQYLQQDRFQRLLSRTTYDLEQVAKLLGVGPLNLTDKQQGRIDDATKMMQADLAEAEEDYRQRVREAKAKHQQTIAQALSPEQRKTLNEASGGLFER